MGGLAHMHRTVPTDDWQVNVAMDMTGQVSANFIKTGELIANNGTYELNMATGYVKMQQGEFSGELKAASGTLSDGVGTLSLGNGDLYMSNSKSGGPGIYVTKSGSNYYACWGAVNSAARNSSSYLEVPTYDLIVAGDNASDERLKTDIADVDADMAKELILGIKPKKFRFKRDQQELQFGVIAQDINKIIDDLGIDKNNRLCYEREMDGMFAVDYKQLISPIIKVIQEQQKEIDKLKGEKDGQH